MATNQRPIPAATRRPLQRRRRLSIAVPVLIMSSLIRLSSGFTTISSGLRRTVSNASFRRRPHHPSSSSLPSPAARMRWMHPMHSMSRPLTVSSKPSYLSAVASSSINTETDTVDLPYTDHSPPDFDPSLPPALILHGLLGSKRNFASLAASLAVQLRQKRRIIAVDLRNHGENQRESWRDDMSYRSMARDVMGVMDGEGLEEAVLIGHRTAMDMDILSYLASVRQATPQKKERYPSCHVHEDSTVAHVINLLAKTGYHRVFVVDKDIKPVGVISVADIVKFAISAAKE